MADLNKALIKLWGVEFSNKPERMLHCVKGDTGGMTYKGIARRYHGDWEGWAIIDAVLAKEPDMKKASLVLISNIHLQVLVDKFYQVEFWNPIHGDQIVFQATAEEMFLSAVNCGIRACVKMAQRASGSKVDGLFGFNTLAAINKTPTDVFCDRYTKLEVAHYEAIASDGKNDENDKRFLNGWIARAHAIDGDNASKIV